MIFEFFQVWLWLGILRLVLKSIEKLLEFNTLFLNKYKEFPSQLLLISNLMNTPYDY